MSELKLLQRSALKIGPEDNVAVALSRLESGDEVVLDGQPYKIRSRVPAKHKFALQDLKPGDRISCTAAWWEKRPRRYPKAK